MMSSVRERDFPFGSLNSPFRERVLSETFTFFNLG